MVRSKAVKIAEGRAHSEPHKGVGERCRKGWEEFGVSFRPFPPSLGTLTDGHVVAAVGEARVPIVELCLVAGIGTLRLTGHWIGHGCGGRKEDQRAS